MTCYNHFELCKSIASFPIPVLTGIGHSTNLTVAEMVAYRNAITPTKLAEFLVMTFREFDLEIEKYASVLGNRYLIPLNVFSRDVSIPDKTRNRKQPLKILRGYVDSDEIEIEIPDGFTIEALPEPVLIQNKFGSYDAKVTMKNNIMQYNRKIQINKRHLLMLKFLVLTI